MSVQSVALASLTATYTDSEDEDGLDPKESSEQGNGTSSPPENANAKVERNSPRDSSSNSRSSKKATTTTTNTSKPAPKSGSKRQGLVSYFDDTIISDDEGTAVVVGEAESENPQTGLENGDAGARTPSPVTLDEEQDDLGVTIPPEPVGACPTELQSKIVMLHKRMESGNYNMNKVIQERKDFRNPSIYEKLIQFCNINELGTNYSPDMFDPFKWGKDSYYEELAKTQKTEMDKLEKARKDKTKIEIVSGTAKRANPASGTAGADEDAKRRKSKWDQVAPGSVTTVKSSVVLSQPALSTLTSSATGTKSTVISAFGSLPKKRL